MAYIKDNVESYLDEIIEVLQEKRRDILSEITEADDALDFVDDIEHLGDAYDILKMAEELEEWQAIGDIDEVRELVEAQAEAGDLRREVERLQGEVERLTATIERGVNALGGVTREFYFQNKAEWEDKVRIAGERAYASAKEEGNEDV